VSRSKALRTFLIASAARRKENRDRANEESGKEISILYIRTGRQKGEEKGGVDGDS